MTPRFWLPAARVPPRAILGAVLTVLLADAARHYGGRESVVLAGALDEVAHLATGILVVGAIGLALASRFAVGVLAASILIDLDHIPQYAGSNLITAGTPRPYPHSLLTVLILCVVAAAGRSRARAYASGAMVGLLTHFARDLAEPNSGVALLWPLDNRSFSIPYAAYLASLAVMATLGALISRPSGHAPARDNGRRLHR